MRPIGIITDSHSSITQAQAKELGILVLPMPFEIGEDQFYEDVTLTREQFFQKLNLGARIATSQPSMADVMAIWDKALKDYEQVLYIPISSGLSGSCATAFAMAQEEPYAGRVLVVDNGRVSTPLHRSILDALELIEEGYKAEQIKAILEEARDKMVIYVGVQTLEHLKNGGRITPATAALGTILNIKPVLRFDVGTLDTFKKCRGFAKARKTMLEAIRHDLDTRFKEWYDRGEIYLLAASSSSKDDTEQWVLEIQEAFPDLPVMCDDLSLGVSCHIGYGGLGIGLSCRPKRP
ncbi:MAG: DegV family protein [Lachnospiraceae bacterium]|nr:DegV family protein [Lachnospiraceae bacterium]